jgi:hypothetical protein
MSVVPASLRRWDQISAHKTARTSMICSHQLSPQYRMRYTHLVQRMKETLKISIALGRCKTKSRDTHNFLFQEKRFSKWELSFDRLE